MACLLPTTALERFTACFQSDSETLHLPSSTCIDLLWVILYTICAAAVCLKCSQHHISVCIGSSKFLYLLFSSSSNNLQVTITNSSSNLAAQQIYSANTKYINIAISLTMLKSPETCYDRSWIKRFSRS